MAQIKSWEVSDPFWSAVEPLIPQPTRESGRVYKRKPGGGRKPMSSKKAFAAILYVLRTGCPWKALPKAYGSSSSVHARFLEWQRAGFFVALWRAGLAEHEAMHGIAWEWQSKDGAKENTPLALEDAGSNPGDKEKKRAQAQTAGGRAWNPAVCRRQRSLSPSIADSSIKL